MAEEYINLMIEMDIFKNKDEKIHYILNKDFSNNEYVRNRLFCSFIKNKIEKWNLASKKICLE